MTGRQGRHSALMLLVAVAMTLAPGEAAAQSVGDTFRKVSPAVVVIRARGRDVAGTGEVRFTETGSGVVVSPGR